MEIWMQKMSMANLCREQMIGVDPFMINEYPNPPVLMVEYICKNFDRLEKRILPLTSPWISFALAGVTGQGGRAWLCSPHEYNWKTNVQYVFVTQLPFWYGCISRNQIAISVEAISVNSSMIEVDWAANPRCLFEFFEC